MDHFKSNNSSKNRNSVIYGDIIRVNPSDIIEFDKENRDYSSEPHGIAQYGFEFPPLKSRKHKKSRLKGRDNYLLLSNYSKSSQISNFESNQVQSQCILNHNYQYYKNFRRRREYDGTEYQQTTLYYWNMNHSTATNGDVVISAKKSAQVQSKNAVESTSPRPVSTSGFQSFLRWFKKDEKSRTQRNISKNITYPRDITSSSETLEDLDRSDRSDGFLYKNRALKSYDSSDTLSPPSSPKLGYSVSQSSSDCDSVFSTATSSFAFVQPKIYQPNGNSKKPQRIIADRPYTDSYRKRIKDHEKARELDRKYELTLRKKYKLYSDVEETNNNNKNNINNNNNNNNTLTRNQNQNNLSLPNRPDSEKLNDLHSYNRARRTSSDNSKDRRSGSYVHVKGKRRAPQPPLTENTTTIHLTTRTLSPATTLSRKKRQAPPPPSSAEIQEAISSTSLLEDKEIRAIIEGTSKSLSRNFSPIITDESGSEMEQKSVRPTYISPYLKIREDRKLTDEQKQILIDNVSKLQRKRGSDTESSAKSSTSDVPGFLLEKGQLKYTGTQSPQSTNEKPVKPVAAPSSPISPRPWYKRSNNRDSSKETIPFKKDIILKTLDKKRNKKDKNDLPEVGFARNSIFNEGTKFNFFSKLNEDSKKKDKDSEKRRSGIGIPNISELDREAAEILQRQEQNLRIARESEQMKDEVPPIPLFQEMAPVTSQIFGSKSDDQVLRISEDTLPKSTKQLINKFEANSSNINRITVNPAFIGRKDIFTGDTKNKFNFNLKENEIKLKEGAKSTPVTPATPLSPVTRNSAFEYQQSQQSKLPLPVTTANNKTSSSNAGLLGLWTCPYCTLENPNWKIICEACEKIKPYDKRYINGEPTPIPEVPSTPPKESHESSPEKLPSEWNKKTEQVKKYFQSTPKPATEQSPNPLSKSASETSMSGRKKSPSPSRFGSPNLNGLRRTFFKTSPEKNDPKISVIKENRILEEKSEEKEESLQKKIFKSTITVTSVIATPIPEEIITDTPDLNEVRSARLAKFSSGLEHHKLIDLNEPNIVVKAETEEKLENKTIEIADPEALEREKARLREKIRQMNSKALAEKYPILKKPAEKEPEEKQEKPTEEKSVDRTSKETPERNLQTSLEKNVQKPTEKILNLSPEKKIVAIHIRNDSRSSPESNSPIITTSVPFVSMTTATSSTAISNSSTITAIATTTTNSTIISTPTVIPITATTSSNTDAQKLGAIKKLIIKKPSEIPVKEENKVPPIEEKIINREIVKPKKISISVQTGGIPKSMKERKAADDDNNSNKSLNNLNKINLTPKNSPLLQRKFGEKPIPSRIPESNFVTGASCPKTPPRYRRISSENGSNKHSIPFSMQEKETIHEITDQLKSRDGIENFKATLRTSPKSITNTGTMAINKLLRNLENAIVEGKHDLAAELAVDLAKMKVSLSVTRQKDRPKSELDLNFTNIEVNLFVEDRVSKKGPLKINISPLMTLLELKKKISKEFEIPVEIQRWTLNDQEASDDKKTLMSFNIKDESGKLYLYIEDKNKNKVEKKDEEPTSTQEAQQIPEKNTRKDSFSNQEANILNITDSDDDGSDNLNEKISNEEGAVGCSKPPISPTKKTDNGWTCQLCTLINPTTRPGCLACSSTKPAQTKLTNNMPEEPQKFLDNDKVVLPDTKPNEQKNDLNIRTTNRKSSEVFNILVEEAKSNPKENKFLNLKNYQIPPQNSIVMTAFTSSPNITRNKYRGVDNFHPSNPALWKLDYNKPATPFKAPIETTNKHAPVVTKLILKTSPEKNPPKSNENHYQQLVNLDTADIVPNLEEFECSICMVGYKPREGVVLRDCLHVFCKECLANTIIFSEDAEIKCPFIDQTYSCSSVLQEREIRGLVSKENYDKHLAKSVTQAEHKIENTFHCKTPNCRGWCIFEDNVNHFKCPVCTMVNCLTCGVIHDGLNCKQYQDQLNSESNCNEESKLTKEMFQEMVEKGDAMHCPTCQVIVIKKWGCDYVRCTMCKTEICWVTRGPRWGPNGKGDTSAGCKCGVNGKKCHPKCNYCH